MQHPFRRLATHMGRLEKAYVMTSLLTGPIVTLSLNFWTRLRGSDQSQSKAFAIYDDREFWKSYFPAHRRQPHHKVVGSGDLLFLLACENGMVGADHGADSAMADIKTEALDWIRSYNNFPQLHSINKAGFPIGRTTWFPIEDDWSIHATGYRGNSRVKQIRNNPHLEAMWLDTTGQTTRVVRIRGVGYHTESASLIRIYNEREDIARSKGDGFGERLSGKDITDTVCCTHITPLRVRLAGFGNGKALLEWDVDPSTLLPEPPPEDGSEEQSGPTGFRQELEMSIERASERALEWCRSVTPRQHLFTVEGGFPTGHFADLYPDDDWSVYAVVPADAPVIEAVRANSRIELDWIDISHDWSKMRIGKSVFVQGYATVQDPEQSKKFIGSLDRSDQDGRVAIHVRPRRIRTEGFGEGLQLYAWNL